MSNQEFSVNKPLIAVVILAIVAVIVFFGSWYTVDQGERGVILRNGAVIGVAEPGLHFKVPVIDSVVDVSTQTHTMKFNKVESYSRDQQPATLIISVSYHIPESGVEELYSRYGSINGLEERVIARKIYDQVKTTFGQFTAMSAVQERANLSLRLNENVKKSMDGQPVTIESVQIEEIGYSPAYETSVEDRMKAEVAVFTRQQNLETEKISANIAVTQAKAQAEKVRLQGEAEADAIKAKGDALNKNPNLVSLISAERWDGKLPSTMVPNGTLPFLNMNAIKDKENK